MKRYASLIFFLLLFNVPLYSSPADEQKIVGDPFTDFSDFETTEEEESIERFYTYGRFIHLSLSGQLLTPMGGMSTLYGTGFLALGKLSYFFDWNFAITVGAGFGLSQAHIPVRNNSSIATLSGDVQWFTFDVGLKYYINFNEISKILAFMNPFITVGGGMYTCADYISALDLQTAGLNALNFNHTALAPGIFLGFGFEIPVYQKDLYLGLEFTYHMTFFSDLNPNLSLTGDIANQIQPIDYSGRIFTTGLNLIWNLN